MRKSIFSIAAIPACTAAIALSASAPRAKETAAIDRDGTRIQADSAANAIRFHIDGQETARLDASRLHVRENIGHGGMPADYGHIGFDNRAGWKECQRLKTESRDAP